MWGKLIKYEMKSMLKIFALAWGAIMVVALISGFTTNGTFFKTNNFFNTSFNSENTFNALMIFIYIAIGIGMIVLTLIFIIQRFNKGLLGSEGYLMFTIPTTSRALITAKGISATIIVILSGIAGILSGFLFILPTVNFKELPNILSWLSKIIDIYPVVVPAGILSVITGIIVIINFIYHVYASISLGHLSGNHRNLMAILAFVGLAIAEDIIQTVGLMAIGKSSSIELWIENIDFTDSRILLVIGAVALIELIGIIIYHIITEIILSKKLNLE